VRHTTQLRGFEIDPEGGAGAGLDAAGVVAMFSEDKIGLCTCDIFNVNLIMRSEIAGDS
jgi:hypothetical protein